MAVGNKSQSIIGATFEANPAKIAKRFQAINGKVVDVVKKAFRESVKATAKEAKKLAPKATKHRVNYSSKTSNFTRPKTLRQEIKYKVGEKNQKIWGMVRANFPGWFQEHGTGKGHVGAYVRPPKNRGWIGHGPTPFMGPAWDKSRGLVEKNIKGAIK